MYCKKCGKKLNVEDRFCSFCGSPVEKKEILEPTVDDFEITEESTLTYKQVNSLQKDRFDEEWEKEERREKFTFMIFGVLIVVLIAAIIGGVGFFVQKEDEKNAANSTGNIISPSIPGNLEVVITPQLIMPNENPEENDSENTTGENTTTPNDSLVSKDTTEFIIYDSDVRYLVLADLNGLTAWEIRVARNEIFARHGRMFDSPELKEYFESKSWYVPSIPAVEFNNSCLTNVELENLNFIINYEKVHNLN